MSPYNSLVCNNFQLASSVLVCVKLHLSGTVIKECICKGDCIIAAVNYYGSSDLIDYSTLCKFLFTSIVACWYMLERVTA